MARLPAVGKTVAVVVALVLAAVATFAIFTYVRGLEQRAFEDAEPIDVFVATEAIPAGTTSEDASQTGLIGQESRPRITVPEGAITSLEQVAGLVTEDRILPGEVIVQGRWVDSADVAIEFEIPGGFEAISIQVGVPPGVAGFVRAGDRVSLVATVEEPPTVTVDEEGTALEELGDVRSQYLLQGIEVLSVGQVVVSEEGDDGVERPSDQVLLTVAMEPEDVERAVFAIENGELYFTLLPEGAEPAETPGRILNDLFE